VGRVSVYIFEQRVSNPSELNCRFNRQRGEVWTAGPEPTPTLFNRRVDKLTSYNPEDGFKRRGRAPRVGAYIAIG